MTRWRIGGTARTYKGPGRANIPAHVLLFIDPMKAVDELDDVLDLSLQRKLAGKVSTEQTYNRQRISIGMKEDGWW